MDWADGVECAECESQQAVAGELDELARQFVRELDRLFLNCYTADVYVVFADIPRC